MIYLANLNLTYGESVINEELSIIGGTVIREET